MRHETAQKIIDALEAHYGVPDCGTWVGQAWWNRGDLEYVREALIEGLTDSMGLFMYVGPSTCGDVIQAYKVQLTRCGVQGLVDTRATIQTMWDGRNSDGMTTEELRDELTGHDTGGEG